jgi:hypothetical protein
MKKTTYTVQYKHGPYKQLVLVFHEDGKFEFQHQVGSPGITLAPLTLKADEVAQALIQVFMQHAKKKVIK